MIEIYLNDQKIDVTLENEKTVFDIVDELDKYFRESGQGVVIDIIKVDDKEFNGFSEELKNIDLENVKEIKIYTSISNSILSLDILYELHSYLGRVPKGAEDIAILLQSDKISEAMYHIKNLSSGLQWILQVINNLDNVDNIEGFSLKDIEIDGVTFEDKILELRNILEELIESFENEDYILLSDLIEYEISPICQDLQKLTQRAIDRFLKLADETK